MRSIRKAVSALYHLIFHSIRYYEALPHNIKFVILPSEATPRGECIKTLRFFGDEILR